MPIIIRDETANVLILTIDNSGNMAFGDGTPINMLTLGGYGIIDSLGVITHGLGTTSGNIASGAGNCGIHQSVGVTTLSGRIPNVQLDTNYPAARYFEDFRDPTDPTSGGGESVVTLPNSTVHTIGPFAGGFSIVNANEGDGYVDNPGSPYYDNSLTFAPFAYRWI